MQAAHADLARFEIGRGAVIRPDAQCHGRAALW
jgi:hypothetical protein